MRHFSRWRLIARTAALFSVGLAIGLSFVFLAGESPWHVLKIMARSACGSPYDFGMTLFYATPLLFTGLSVSIAFRGGLFNIGAEGQLVMGALAAAIAGAALAPLPESLHWVAPWLGGVAAFTAGALWGWIPGVLKAYRGAHEVIVTMMLNFVAAALASYFVLYHFKNPNSQNPETAPVPEFFRLKPFAVFMDAPVTWALPIAIIACGLVLWFFARTRKGFEISVLGASPSAARYAGISEKRVVPWLMAVSGGVAGLVGLAEVMGNAGKFKLGFSPDYGFLGIAVALVARNHPIGILFSAFLFGGLQKGASDLDLETEKVSRELSVLLQAVLILAISAQGFSLRGRKRGASLSSPDPSAPGDSKEAPIA